VQPLLGGDRQAALFGDSDEVTEMAKIHEAMLYRHVHLETKSFSKGRGIPIFSPSNKPASV
jgi:hypothetical protein